MVNMQRGNIASRTNRAGCIYTEYARTKHVYIYIDNFPFSPQVWGEPEQAVYMPSQVWAPADLY